MCKRYSVVSDIMHIEKRFNVRSQYKKYFNPNIAYGDLAPVITGDNNKELQFFQFGLTPHWAKEQLFVQNARCEGDRNKSNDPAYSGNMGIMLKTMFKKLIRHQRCIIVADAFIEGFYTDKASKNYLVFPRNKKRPFAMAGVWDSWLGAEKETIHSFAILTTPANELMQKMECQRAPFILPPHLENTWLNSKRLADITAIMKPFDARFYNAYPIENSSDTSLNLLKPIGDKLMQENSMGYANKERVQRSRYLPGGRIKK